jgi:hypothetical protein
MLRRTLKPKRRTAEEAGEVLAVESFKISTFRDFFSDSLSNSDYKALNSRMTAEQ